ncbi:hypothetical protein RP20_CCG028556 [Aedes albopictus]|nr:hypothetical protein RP20_CCG028556 [Aedes albopictus]
MQPVENLCRICTRSEEWPTFVCIFDTTLQLDRGGLKSEQQQQVQNEWEPGESESTAPLVRTVAEVMAGCLDIEIKPNDQMPRRICPDCKARLQESWALRETFKASEKRLRQLLRSESASPKVKLEITMHEGSDDEDFSMQMSFMDEEVLEEDDRFVEKSPIKVTVAGNRSDPLNAEFGWKFSDLTKGHYRTRKGDDLSWEWVEADDHRCCGCFKVFNTKVALEKHCKRDHKPGHHGNENNHYECNACLKLFATSDFLSLHQKIARVRQLLHCNVCDILTPSKRQLNAHLKTHSAEEIATNHINKTSKPKPVSTEEASSVLEKSRAKKIFLTFDYYTFEGYFCCDCSAYCDSKREMKRHGEKQHQGNRGFDEEHSCFACLRSFDTKEDYDRHMLDLNARHVYHCKTCREMFRTADKLREHQQTSARHEGFVELDMLDVKEEIEVEEKVELRLKIQPMPAAATAVAQVGRRRRATNTVTKVERAESPPRVEDDADGSGAEETDDDEDYQPEEEPPHKEPYGRRLYVQPKTAKRNDPDMAEISVVDISGQDVVRCCGCYRTFITEEELFDHCNQSHRQFQEADQKERPYECDRCFRRFVKAVSLQIHKGFVKNVLVYSCKLCNEKFDFQTPFLLHYDTHERFTGREDRRGPKPKQPEEDGKFYCCFTACKASFPDYCDLLTHVDGNHGVKRNQFKDYRDSDENCCEVCFRSFSNYRGLLRHVVAQRKSNSGARHTCSTCGVQMKSMAQLKDHENKHLGIKPYECDVCQKSFGTKTILKNHMIVHQSDRPFSCEICGKTFARKRNYKDHAMTHTDEKPWECEICKLTFRIESQFLTHKRRHTGIRPYKCKFCDKVFSHATDRKRHEMAAHTGEKPHQCSFCPLAFIRKRQLVIHERTHTGEKPYECQQCGQAFIQQSYLTRHLATHKQRDEPAFQ